MDRESMSVHAGSGTPLDFSGASNEIGPLVCAESTTPF